MEHGYVDVFTRQVVSGWAAEMDRIDEAVDVVILVNNHKTAEVRCDILRPDLQKSGEFGNGRHGFRCQFDPPLPEDARLHVAVRFARSGEPVENGDAVLEPGTEMPRLLQPRRTRPFTVPAPTHAGALFRQFTLYEAERGLYDLLCRWDFRGTRREQLEYAAFGRVVSAPAPVGRWDEGTARNLLYDLLSSARFQEEILAAALHALPEKRRVFFVHIPKCAGTDLLAHLSARYPFLSPRWQEPAWTSQDELFQALAEFARELPFSDSILIGGHVPLGHFVERGLLRPSDRVLTVVRDPTDIAVSSINYLLTRFQANLGKARVEADVHDWMNALGVSTLPAQMTPQFIRDVSHLALYSPEIVQPNSLCHFLGGGTVDQVVATLAGHHAELTSMAHYGQWLRDAWGVVTPTRMNVSTKYISLASLPHQDLAYLQGLSREDRKLYDLIEKRLAASGRCSLLGDELL